MKNGAGSLRFEYRWFKPSQVEKIVVRDGEMVAIWKIDLNDGDEASGEYEALFASYMAAKNDDEKTAIAGQAWGTMQVLAAIKRAQLSQWCEPGYEWTR